MSSRWTAQRGLGVRVTFTDVRPMWSHCGSHRANVLQEPVGYRYSWKLEGPLGGRV